VQKSAGITDSSPARLFDELLKTLLSGSATDCYRMLRSGGLFKALLPAFDDWLDENGDETLDHSLQWIDDRMADGGSISPQLFLALFFGDCLEKRAEEFSAQCGSFQDSVDHALAAFMQETCSMVLIPQRTVMRLREILLLSERLLKIPGRKPANVVGRPAFREALEYLRFKGSLDSLIGKAIGWWEHYSSGQGLPPVPPEPAAEPGKERHGRRSRHRRRRRHKPKLTS
jgi:poly(A) polymerase